ncbi:hypothetical protein ABZ278_004172 [Vibrio vulnificus]
MSPNENYLTKPSLKTIENFLIFAFSFYGDKRDAAEALTYNIFPIKPSEEKCKQVLDYIKTNLKGLENTSDSTLIFLIFNTLVESGYATKGKDGLSYHFTESGYKKGFKLTNPIKYLFKFHWKVLLPLIASIIFLCIELKYN